MEEESEIVRNNWRNVKAIAGNSPPAMLCGNPMLAEWSTTNLNLQLTGLVIMQTAGTEYLNGSCLNFRLCNGYYLVQSSKCEKI